jgi:hypothetical protein
MGKVPKIIKPKRAAKGTGKPKSDAVKTASLLYFSMARPTGIEPVHLAPEASALSPELRAQDYHICNILYFILFSK